MNLVDLSGLINSSLKRLSLISDRETQGHSPSRGTRSKAQSAQTQLRGRSGLKSTPAAHHINKALVAPLSPSKHTVIGLSSLAGRAGHGHPNPNIPMRRANSLPVLPRSNSVVTTANATHHLHHPQPHAYHTHASPSGAIRARTRHNPPSPGPAAGGFHLPSIVKA